MFLGFFIFSLSSVQTSLARRLTDALQSATNQELQVNKIQIDLLGNVNFRGVVGFDHYKDTLFFIDEFKATLTAPSKALQGDIEFDSATLEGFDLNLKQYPGDSLTNLEYFIQGLGLNKTNKNTQTAFGLKKMTFSEGTVHIDLPQLKKGQQTLHNLQFEVANVRIQEKEITGVLQHLQFSNVDGLSVQKLSAVVAKTAQNLSVDSLEIQTATSKLSGSLQMEFPTPDSDTTLDLKIHLERLNPKEWGWETYYSKNIRGELQGKGPLQRFAFSKLKVAAPDFELRATGVLSLDSLQNLNAIHTDIASLTFTSALVNKSPLQKLLAKNKIKLRSGETFNFKGVTDYSSKGIDIDGVLQQGINQLNTSFQQLKTADNTQQFSLTLDATPMDLSVFDPSGTFGLLRGKLALEGTQKAGEWTAAAWTLKLDQFQHQQKIFEGLQSEGTLQKGQWKGKLSVTDSQIELQSRFDLSPKSKLKVNELEIDLAQLDLSLLNPLLEPGKALLSGTSSGRFTDTQIDKINGNFSFDSIQLKTTTEKVLFDDFMLEIKANGLNRSLFVSNSDLIQGSLRGNFQLSQLQQLLKNTLSRAYPFTVAQPFVMPQNALVDLKISQRALATAFPNWGIKNDFTLSGLLHSEASKGRLQMEAPLINYQNSIVKGLSLRLEPESSKAPNTIAMKALQIKNYTFSELSLVSSQEDRGMLLQFKAKGRERQDLFSLEAIHTISENEELTFRLLPSSVRYKNTDWTFRPDAEISYNSKNKRWSVAAFQARAQEQRIALEGTYANNEAYSIQTQLEQVALEGLLPEFKNFSIQGDVSLKLDTNRSPAKNNFDLNMDVAALSFNKKAMGEFALSLFGNNQVGSYTSALTFFKDGKTTLSGEGNILNSNKQPSINFDLEFDTFRLDFLNQLANGTLDEIQGMASGMVNLWGPLNALRHDGELRISEGGLSIPYLNLFYAFDPKTRIVLANQSFNFSKAVFRNTAFDTKGIIDGSYSHSNFKNWEMDFAISTDRMLVFNIEESPERIFYGQGFFGGTGKLVGPSKSLRISLVGETEEGTNFKIPWTEDYGLVDTSYIDFVSKTKKDSLETTDAVVGLGRKILEMDFELDINDKALIEIVIDPETNSSLSGRGVGTLLMEINTENKFNMWGDFITIEGNYNFRNLGLIDKKFTLRPGGSVNWEGDPLGAQMNMQAVYQVPGGANPALLLDNPNFNRKIPTEVEIQLQGNLLQPDNPIFAINFPNTNNVVVSEINYRLADPQRSQLQAISLLSQGVFISDVSVSVQGITNNLYEKASDVFSSLLGESDEKLKVGVNYLQGDRNNELDVQTEDRLGLTLSTQISDKILINGKIGVPVGGFAQTQVVGDVQIDFILNKDNTLRAKVFNKENEFRYIGEDFGYTQGMGLSYDVDFNTFQELIQKIKRKKPKDSLRKSSFSELQENGTEFRDKNQN